MQPFSGNQRPDLLTALMNMSLVPRLPRKMHLCRSSSNVPYMIAFFSRKIDTFFHYFHIFTFFRQKRAKKRNKREKQRKKMTSRNISSIENQMQVIPLARNRREKK